MTEILENPYVRENNAKEQARQDWERWISEGGALRPDRDTKSVSDDIAQTSPDPQDP